METKKGVFQQNQPQPTQVLGGYHNEPIQTKPLHQHNTAPPHHLRLLQYGLKIPNHQHQQINQQSSTHQQQYYGHSQYNVLPSSYQHVHQTQHQPPPVHHYQNAPSPLEHPQIWVPHQPPLHYHQSQQKVEQNAPNKGPTAEVQMQQTPKTPVTKPKETVERKKSASGVNQQLRSPVAKRPLEAPVTMQGWLHKQGSEGLMLWKKRWFVLCDYCLFYYKGPEEEKLLGSILLPSYKVSVCSAEDKIYRKFAFKCEHANMRTYILAADSQELMMQWIRVLNMACLLQNNNESDKQSGHSVSSLYNHSAENSDSGFHQQYQLQRNTPIHIHSSSNTTDLSNTTNQELGQYNQPLYANAPPKPRRLTDGGYSSPSPDIGDKYAMESKYLNPQQMNPIYVSRTCKSPVNLYSQNGIHNNVHMAQYTYPQPGHKYMQEYGAIPTKESIPQSAERRTPDTYGRSKSNPMKIRTGADYEDVYGDQSAMYKRPLSPVAYTNIKKTNPQIQRHYNPVYMDVQLRKQHNSIPRPHSADFLEYEVKHRNLEKPMHMNQQQPRPKSSLDINRHSPNDYFYSEEWYAEKMRKSAQYLAPNMPKYYASLHQDYNNQRHKYIETETGTFPLTRSNTQPTSFQTAALSNYARNVELQPAMQQHQPVRSRSVLSEGSLSKELYIDMRSSPREQMERNVVSPAPVARHDQMYGSPKLQSNIQDYPDQFTRSASARLARGNVVPNERQQYEERNVSRDGERKREESMKRLLEWKQRMLQSPLNRKLSSNLMSSARVKSMDGRRSVPHYNSYSSDDEDYEDRSRKRAGRTMENLSESLTPIPALSSSTTVFNLAESSVVNDKENEYNEKTTDSNVLTQPLKITNNQLLNTAHISSLRSEYSDKFEDTPVITEIKSNGALVKSILAEFEKKTTESPKKQIPTATTNQRRSQTDTPKDNGTFIEENYMSMTPKKSVLDPQNFALRMDEGAEESPYVEMTQGINVSLLNPNNELQPYEIVCFSNGKIEPLYMELNQLPGSNLLDTSTTNEKPNKELPDILIQSQSNTSKTTTKSDSSDADDEASKELDSLDTPCHPRFSLSDTFRPASYYLGAARVIPEFQDSSDSELVSPPPIPTSPPPIDDFDHLDETTNDYSFSEHVKKETKTLKKDEESGSGKNYLAFSSLKDEDTSSLYSVNVEDSRRFGSRLSQNSDTDSVELRLSMSQTSEYERMLKRRPVSEDFYDELESLDSRFNETIDSIDLDRYLKELEISTVTGNDSSFNKSYHDYENLCIMSRAEQIDEQSNNDIKEMARHSDSSVIMPGDFRHRVGSESRESSTAELSGCASPHSIHSVRATSSLSHQKIPAMPYFIDVKSLSNTPSLMSAPYYYSDLSMNTSNHMESKSTMLTLNNQRSSMNGSKRDIMHIVNPIGCNTRMHPPHHKLVTSTFKLAAEARSVSVDFLNLTDKSGHIDKKNIYESDTLKRMKAMESVNSIQSNPEMLNVFPRYNTDKMFTSVVPTDSTVRRSHSLEGLLENVLSETPESSGTIAPQSESSFISSVRNITDLSSNTATEGSHVWEEDSIWREQLRRVSQRHTKSLDDLDCIGGEIKEKVMPKKPKQIRSIIRGAMYVNDSVCNIPKLKMEESKSSRSNDNDMVCVKDESQSKQNSFTIDREKLRQWDLLSSAPSDENAGLRSVSTVVEAGAGVGLHTSQPPVQQNTHTFPASGSISINRDTFPRMMNDKRLWTSNPQPQQSRSEANIARQENNYGISNRGQQQRYYSNQDSNQLNLSGEQQQQHSMPRKAGWQWSGRMNFSAGELLGRTHEELVLLLIQLRRQSTNTCHAIELCYAEIDNIQSQLNMMDAAKRLENLQKLEQIKQHLLDLEKQYEKGKPLVNLVDNMVKLGSLYRSPPDRNYNPYVRDRIEFNQQIQERRLLAEERRDWNRLSPNHTQLQAKVQQLYQLDRLIQEESGTLQGLQQDKEEIERALGGLRQRLIRGHNDPAELEQARKQQAILENELSKVHLMLAQNSKKLEETVAGNARLEQELLVLRQKLQISRQHRSSPQFSNPCDSLPCVVGTSAMLESDLHRVQQKVGDLQRQRQELSMQVRQLTDKSLQQQIRSASATPVLPNQAGASGNKKKVPALWRETDLDTMNIIDHGNEYKGPPATTPLYINTDLKLNAESEYYSRGLKTSDSTSDDATQILPQEKQEIKTVRIVKRESERRQRDREKTGQVKWDTVLEEDDNYLMQSKILSMGNDDELMGKTGGNVAMDNSKSIYSDLPTTSSTDNSLDKSPELSPIFKSEAARQIIIEMSNQSESIPQPSQSIVKNNGRRAVPKEKRRHYTAPHNNLIMKSLNQLPTDDSAFDRMILNSRRARDDLDMERALRQRIDAPDVVRSTLSSKELKYNENTIDNILGTPNKISIPERYIPEKLPQLSVEEQQHRLRKVESIKKMLSDTAIISGSSANLASSADDGNDERPSSSLTNKATTKMIEEKRQREHLLQLNQILAKQVMEMSKIVAGTNNPDEP